MPVVSCPACGDAITLPFPWKFPAFSCPRCAHVITGRRTRSLHLRGFAVGVSAATAAQMRRVVPILTAARGAKMTREEFFALAVAALAEKLAAGVPKGSDTAEASALETSLHDCGKKEPGGGETTARIVPLRRPRR